MRPAVRLACVALVGVGCAIAQDFSFGVKGGVPFNDAVKVTDRARYFSDKAPWVFGPAFELRLLAGFGVEADLFYRRLEYSTTNPAGATATSRTTGQVWELPVLARFHGPGALFRPTLAAGLSYRRMARFDVRTLTGSGGSDPPELTGRNGAGATVGAGVEAGGRLVRVSAEVRYTRWGTSSIRSAASGLATQLNQADFLLGIMF